MLTVEYAMKQAGALWRTYHDSGTARAERAGERALRFVVEDCDMPDDFRRILRGYIAAIIELTGAREPAVSEPARKGKAWLFEIAWSGGGGLAAT